LSKSKLKNMLIRLFISKELSTVNSFVQNNQPRILSSSFGTFTVALSLKQTKPLAGDMDFA
jgi:hypothetical protein